MKNPIIALLPVLLLACSGSNRPAPPNPGFWAGTWRGQLHSVQHGVILPAIVTLAWSEETLGYAGPINVLLPGGLTIDFWLESEPGLDREARQVSLETVPGAPDRMLLNLSDGPPGAAQGFYELHARLLSDFGVMDLGRIP